MSVKLLTEHHFEFLGLKGGCTCSSESTLVKMQHATLLDITRRGLNENTYFSDYDNISIYIDFNFIIIITYNSFHTFKRIFRREPLNIAV